MVEAALTSQMTQVLGPKFTLSRCFHMVPFTMTLSLAAGTQHISLTMVYTELDIHSSPHVTFSHMAQISEKTLIKHYSVFV